MTIDIKYSSSKIKAVIRSKSSFVLVNPSNKKTLPFKARHLHNIASVKTDSKIDLRTGIRKPGYVTANEFGIRIQLSWGYRVFCVCLCAKMNRVEAKKPQICEAAFGGIKFGSRSVTATISKCTDKTVWCSLLFPMRCLSNHSIN